MRKMLFSSVAVLLIVFWVGCGGENPLLPTKGINSNDQVSIEVEKVISHCLLDYPISGNSRRGTITRNNIVNVWIYLKIRNLSDEDIVVIDESDFLLEDIKDSMVYSPGREISFLFDSKYEPPQNYNLADGDFLVWHRFPQSFKLPDAYEQCSLKPKDEISIGLFTDYTPERQKGDWHITYNSPKGRIEIPIQKLIDRSQITINLKEPEQDMTGYFPLQVGNYWHYECIVDGKHEDHYEVEISRKIVLHDMEYFEVTGKKSPSYYTFYDNKVWKQNVPSENILPSVYLQSSIIVGKETITVPAGTFECIKVGGKNINDPYLWYAKDVGLVQIDYRRLVPGVNPYLAESFSAVVLTDYKVVH